MGKFRMVKVPTLEHWPHKIFISGKKDAENEQLIKDNNIKVIMEVSDATSFKNIDGVVRFHVWMSDPLETLAPLNPLFEAAEVFKIALDTAAKFGGNVLINCIHGSNRSSLVAALMLMETQKISLQEAVKICKVKDNKPWMQEFKLKW